MNWSRENLAYIAGLLEGEGNFNFFTRKGRTGQYIKSKAYQISVGTTDKDIADKLQKLLGLGKVFGPYMKLGNSKITPRKPIYQYKISTKEHVYAVCAAVYEFMGDRRKQAIQNLMFAYKG